MRQLSGDLMLKEYTFSYPRDTKDAIKGCIATNSLGVSVTDFIGIGIVVGLYKDAMDGCESLICNMFEGSRAL
jgi:hypothetical protein